MEILRASRESLLMWVQNQFACETTHTQSIID
jgi:hypothetical protein